ncbi:MAG: M55 family metallopeptidase [Promethearchaeota archaeon]
MGEKLKIYISADIEGISGVVSWEEVESGKPDYEYFRKIMSQEVNAAVEAAFDNGATDVIVRDAHSSARNILPTHINRKAQLLRDWSSGPLDMMEGIKEDFDATFFIGYHAKAGTPDATLKHTFTTNIYDLRVNNVSLSEAGWNALIAGYYNVPLIFVSGDKALCEQVKSFNNSIVTVPVKEGIGKACLTLHPDEAQERIKKGVTEAITKKNHIKPFQMNSPYELEISFTCEHLAWKAKWYPGAKLIAPRIVGFKTQNFFECMRFLCFVG